MPRVTALNLKQSDNLRQVEAALKVALTSLAEMKINDWEIDFVPVFAPDGFHPAVARIDVDLWETGFRTKESLQEVAMRMALAFREATGSDRKVKVVLKPYDVDRSGWVSL